MQQPHESGHGSTTRDRGVSLIEILVATVLLGIVGVGVMVAFGTATRSSALSARVAGQQASLATAHDAISNSIDYTDCASGDPLAAYAAVLPENVTIQSVEYWNGAEFTGTCVGRGLQRVTLSNNGRTMQMSKGAQDGLPMAPVTVSPDTTTSTTTTTTTTEPPPTTTEPPPTTTTEPAESGDPPVSTTAPETTTTSTTTTTTIPIVPWNPVTAAEGFTILTRGNAQMQLSSTGAIAVGGDFVTRNWHSIVTGGGGAARHVAPGETEKSGLVVNGTLDMSNSGPSSAVLTVVRGNVYVGSLNGAVKHWNGVASLVRNDGAQQWFTPRVDTNSTQSDGSILRSGVFPFAEAFTALTSRSADLAALDPATCEAVHPVTFSGSSMQLSPNGVNVLNTTTAALSGRGWIEIGTGWSVENPLVVNITDGGNVTFPTYQWAQGADPAAVIWNFPNASLVHLNGGNNFGTVFAPTAAVRATNSYSNHNGTVIAHSFLHDNGGATLTSTRFAAQISCPEESS